MAASVTAGSMSIPQTIESVIQLYQSRLSPDNSIRTEAESRLTLMENEIPGDYVIAVMTLLKTHQDDHVRQQAALNIKQILRQSTLVEYATEEEEAQQPPPTGIWQKLPEDAKQLVKSELISSMESPQETSKVVRSAVCDTTSLLASKLLSPDGWPEVEHHIFRSLSSENALCQVSGLQLLSNLVSHLSNTLTRHTEEVRNFVSRLLESPSTEVRLECVNLIASIVESSKRGVWKYFKPCIDPILQSLLVALENPDDDYASRFLVSLIHIGEENAAYYDASLRNMSNTLFAVSRNSLLSDRIRQLSVEVLITIVEGKPKMCKKVQGFVDGFLLVLIELMVGVEDDPDWMNNDKENFDDEDDEQTTDDVAEAGLDRVAAAMGGEVILPKLQTIIVRYLNDPEGTWRMKHAAMMAVSQTVEHVPQEDNAVEAYLEQIIPLCLMSMRDQHPRVRFAACQAIGQAATDAQPLIEEMYASSIMPALISLLDDPAIRIQTHAARALTNFCEEMDGESLSIYLDSLVHKLLELVTANAPRPLLSACITTLACVAPVVESKFVKYYPVVVPAMKEIVRSCVLPTDGNCRERALECITLVALAVGDKAFAGDTVECMDALMLLWTTAADCTIQHSGDTDKLSVAAPSKTEGPSETINDSLCRMCRVLGVGFTSYLQHIMPRLFRILTQTPCEMSVEDLAGYSKSVCLVSVSNGKTIGMKTYVALEIEQMTNLLYTFVSTIGDDFKEYIVQTVDCCLPLLEYHFCEKVLQMALTILAEVFKVARRVADKESNDTQKALYYEMISTWLWTSVDKGFVAMQDDTMMLENFMEIPKGIASMIKGAGSYCMVNEQGSYLMTAEQASVIIKKVFDLLEYSCSREEQATNVNNSDEHDEDDEDDLEGEQRFELEVAGSITEILSAIMENYPNYYLQTASESTVEFIKAKLIIANTRGGESGLARTLALYVIIELVGMGDPAFHLWIQFLPSLIDALHCTDPIIRQPAAHGLKLALKQSANLSADVVVTIARSLIVALEKSNNLKKPLDENDQGATDNIVSAIGVLVFNHEKILGDSGDVLLGPTHLLKVWLANLPLKVDDEEGQLVHDTLIQLVDSGNELVLGHDLCNLPYLLAIFGEIYKTTHSTTEIDAKLIQIIRRHVPNLGHISSVIHEVQLQRPQQPMNKEQIKNLEKLLKDAGQDATVSQA